MNRTLRAKDSFLAVFPSYGVIRDSLGSEARMEYRYQQYHDIEMRPTNSPDKEHHLKRDEIKRYTEEWLKTANMRGKR